MKKIILLLAMLVGAVLADDRPQQKKYDTVIIGAGVSGVTAGTTLAKAGKNVLILEALDRDGGRIHTMKFGDGLVEIGAEWLHGIVNHPAAELAAQTNITILTQISTMDTFTSDGSTVNGNLVNEIMDYLLEEVANEKTEQPRPLGELMTERLQEYLKKNRPDVLDQKEFIQMVLRSINLAVGTIDGADDWNEVSTWSQYEMLDGSQSSSWGRKGYHTFFELMLNTYNGGPGIPNLEIKLSTVVTNIKWSPEGGRVTVTAADGTKYEAENVIVTVSLGVLKEKYTTLFTPKLPIEKINAIRNISMGYVDKMILSFEEAWWPKEIESFAFLWTDKDLKEMNDDWTTKVFGASSPMGADNVLTLWISGEAAKTMETISEDEVKAKCVGLLRRFMGRNTTVPEPTGFIRTKWYSNKYARGSYSFDNLSVATYPTARDDLAAPLLDKASKPRVMFAGEATDKTHYSTVHGAAFSGRREAQRILGAKIN